MDPIMENVLVDVIQRSADSAWQKAVDGAAEKLVEKTTDTFIEKMAEGIAKDGLIQLCNAVENFGNHVSGAFNFATIVFPVISGVYVTVSVVNTIENWSCKKC